MVQFYHPRGWDYQYRTDLLLNYNLTYDKQLTNLERGSKCSVAGV
ncbi:hypothetical protein [Chitinophaga sedimenti]|nr:hypothetical protein [Chitinophaga sedimenti]